MIDAIIIADTGDDTFSASSSLRLKIGERMALIQNIRNLIENQGRIIEPVEGEHDSNWHDAPRLNGIMLFSYLQKSGHNVALVDSYYRERNTFLKLLRDNPKVIIISTTFIVNKRELRNLVDDIRSEAPGIQIVAGGPFVYSSFLLQQRSNDKDYDVVSPMNDFLFLSKDDNPDIDYFIISRSGLDVLSELLSRLKSGSRSTSDLPNLCTRHGTRYSFSDCRESGLRPSDLDIDWQNVPDSVFRSGVVNVQASVGCPFRCAFCNFVKDRKYMFVKPLEKLVLELKAISAKGIRYVRFVDDNLRLDMKSLNRFCSRLVKEELDLNWMSFVRASTLEKSDIDLIRRSGCIEAQMGVESADSTVLKNMCKAADPEMYSKTVPRLLDAGINCSCCFIVGFPGETRETFRRTLEFIKSIPDDHQEGIFTWSIYPFLLAPLSSIYEQENRTKYGLEGYMGKWRHHTMDSREAQRCIVEAYNEIQNSSPIYSGDNLDMMMRLSLQERRKFMKLRHELSKEFAANPLKEQDMQVIADRFSQVLGESRRENA